MINMTKIEYNKCEKLMNDAIVKMKIAQDEYAESADYNEKEDAVKWEVSQRKADQYYGEALGINQVLVTIGFKHNRMKELSELL